MIRRYGTPLLVNLLIGIPTVLVLFCARWYAAHGRCGSDDLDRSDLGGCTYDQIENADLVLPGLLVTGGFVLLLVLLFDVLLPLSRERPLTPRLLTLPAVLLPYVLLDLAAS